MSTSEMMACDMRSVSTKIKENESQLEAVREQLKAAASERDDEDPALVPLYQSEWDKARVLRQDEVFYVVDECVREDLAYLVDVLKILRRMENTLKTQERALRIQEREK
eukprot:contig_5906_g1337